VVKKVFRTGTSTYSHKNSGTKKVKRPFLTPSEMIISKPLVLSLSFAVLKREFEA
jgi:hypothetical protein